MAIHRTGAPWDARANAGVVSVGVACRGAGRDDADAATMGVAVAITWALAQRYQRRRWRGDVGAV